MGAAWHFHLENLEACFCFFPAIHLCSLPPSKQRPVKFLLPPITLTLTLLPLSFTCKHSLWLHWAYLDHLKIFKLVTFFGFSRWVSSKKKKNLPAKQETWLRSLGQEDTLEKEMATHSSILAWEISWRSLAGYSPWGRRVVHDLAAKQQQWSHI